jgi:hypothetical protein
LILQGIGWSRRTSLSIEIQSSLSTAGVRFRHGPGEKHPKAALACAGRAARSGSSPQDHGHSLCHQLQNLPRHLPLLSRSRSIFCIAVGIKGGAHPCEQQFFGRRGKPVKKMRFVPAEKAFAIARKLQGTRGCTVSVI